MLIVHTLYTAETCAVGGNTGTVNSFAGVQVGDISGGLFNSSVYTDPEKFGCFLSQNIQVIIYFLFPSRLFLTPSPSLQAEAPSFLSNVFQGELLQTALELVTSTLVPSLAKGFGDCNGINVKGGNQAKGLTLEDYGAKYPGAKVQSSGPRAESPNP